MPTLTKSSADALSQLRTIPHETCQSGLNEHWHVGADGHVKAQSICWLYCWGKTGQGSDSAAIRAQEVFDSILDITFNSFDAVVPHDWARNARYDTNDIEQQLAKLLNSP